MTRSGKVLRAPDAMVVALAVLTTLVIAWIAFSLLSALARPPRLKARLDQIDARTERITSISREAGGSSTYLAHAVCTQAGAQAAQALSDQLSRAAAVAGLAAPKVSVTPPDAPELDGRLTPVLFQLEASGAYDAVLGMLRTLGQSEPQLFADTLDLKAETSIVSIKLTGRVLCLPSTP